MPIRFPKKKRRNIVRQAPDGDTPVPAGRHSTRVRLRPRSDWHKRNFLTSVLIPSLFVKRSGEYVPPQFPKIREGEICITWIGHASFLIQTHEVNILIDPIWSKWLKVIKRLKRPGFEIQHLPSIDFVLVTHAHFDHLDRRTLRHVAANQPIVVPTGVGNLVHDLGFHIVHELDYWQTVELGPLKISLTPCHHWGARFSDSSFLCFSPPLFFPHFPLSKKIPPLSRLPLLPSPPPYPTAIPKNPEGRKGLSRRPPNPQYQLNHGPSPFVSRPFPTPPSTSRAAAGNKKKSAVIGRHGGNSPPKNPEKRKDRL